MNSKKPSQAPSLPDLRGLNPQQIQEAIVLYKNQLNLADIEAEYKAIMEHGIDGESVLKELEEMHHDYFA